MPFTLTPARDADRDAVVRMVQLAFGSPREGVIDWLRPWMEHVRVLRDARSSDAAACACLLRVPMAMRVMGRPVPCVGVAGVAVPPEHRGRGAARALMAEALREMHAQNVALSSLYASTQTLYRRVGYELAGHRFEHAIDLRGVPPAARTLPVREATPDDPGVRACHAAAHAHASGALERGPYVWSRVGAWRDLTYHGFALGEPAGPVEAYAFIAQRHRPEGRHDLHLSDAVFTTRRGGEALLAFLADFRSMAVEAHLYGGPLHPLCALLPERTVRVSLKDYWLVRIVDVAAALAARGYPHGLDARLAIELRDDVIESNTGRWTLELERGTPRVARTPGTPSAGAAPSIQLDIRALAPLYTGLLSAHELARLGWLDGPPEAIATAAAVFTAPTPSTGDFY